MRRALSRAVLCCLLAVGAAAADKEDAPRADDAAALELYRSAQIAVDGGEYAKARRLLQILVQRRPRSEWAAKGRRLLDAIPGADLPERAPEADAPFVPAMPATTPEEVLGHLRAAADRGADDQALGEAYDFLDRYPEHSARAEVALAAGALHLRRGEPDRALEFLVPLARGRGPLRSRAIHLLGAALTELGRDADVLKAVPDVDAAGTADRWLALAQVWRAAAEAHLGRRDESAERYRAVAASGQDSPVRAYALAAVATDWDRQGKPDRARDALKRAGREAGRWGLEDLRDSLALASANELARARKLDEAAAAYEDFARKFPRSPLVAQARYERGLALKRVGDRAEAARSFEDLLAKSPNSAYAGDAHLQLGQLYSELGRTDEALSHYRAMAKSSEAKDADREALLLMAQVHYNAKRYGAAVPLYRRWLQGALDDAKTREVKGLLLVCLWQSDREDPQLAELAAQLPEHPLVASLRWELAAKAYKRADWAAAADLFKGQIEADPRSPKTADARFYRAEALRQAGKPEDAADAYRKFMSAHPKDPRAREAAMRLGALLYEAGDSAGAAAAYGRVKGDDDAAADAAYNRALALAKGGKDSAQGWEEFAGKFPTHAKASWAWYEAGRLREERFQNEAAAKDYERASGRGERAKALYALGRLRERLKLPARAQEAYELLRGAEPKDDPARLAGLLRLGLLLELADKPRDAAPLYAEIVERAPKATPAFETARKRLEALTTDRSLIDKR